MTTAPFAEPTRGSHAAALLLCRCGVEVWRTTYESDAREVSNFGRIRHATTKHILKGHVNSAGYRQCKMLDETLKSHRVVARAFIPNPDDKPTVDHIEASEKTNNALTNLRWATQAEQSANTERHATNEKKRRPVRMLDKDTRELIQRFESARAAARYLNKENGFKSIVGALRGRIKTAYGFAWEYEEAETIKGEEWRPIPRELFDLREPHEVSSHGRLKNLTSGRVGSGYTHNSAIANFSLKLADGRTRAIRIARVVASVFLENPENKPLVMHVDGDEANNHVSNLAWATHTDVIQASHDRGRTSWTEEEDAALFNMYESHGRPKRLRLTELPEVLQGRTKSAIRSRLCNLLENGIGKPKQWTEEEDAALRDFVESNRDNRGYIKWKDTALPAILKNRTVQALKHRIHRLSRS